MGESPAASVIAFMFIAAAIVLAAMYMMNYKMTPCEIAVTNLRIILHWNGQAEFLDTSHFRDVFILREKTGLPVLISEHQAMMTGSRGLRSL